MNDWGAPELLDIFTKIVCDQDKYCFLCLRSEKETRLVAPHAFNKFVSVMNIANNGIVNHVCHFCERKALNAIKLYNAAQFASSLSLILNEFSAKYVNNKDIFFQKTFYSNIIENVGLSEDMTPDKLYQALKLIRGNCMLAETETLVVDSHQDRETILQENVTANLDVYQDAIIECPIPLTPMGGSSPTSILPDDPMYTCGQQTDILNENCIILEDDDPLELNPELPQNNINTISNTNSVTEALNTNINQLVITENPPQIVPLHELFSDPLSIKESFLLHPILMSENGDITVPSLSAEIIGDVLIIDDKKKNIKHSHRLQVDMNIIKHNLLIKNKVFLQNMKLHPVTFAVNSCQTEQSCQPKKMKINDTSISNDIVTSTETGFPGIVISDVTSDYDSNKTLHTDKNTEHKTDWEDKIPMDVITFVDSSSKTVRGRKKTPKMLPKLPKLQPKVHSNNSEVIDFIDLS